MSTRGGKCRQVGNYSGGGGRGSACRGCGRNNGREKVGGGRGSATSQEDNPKEALSNLIVAHVTPNFKFHQYGLDASTRAGKMIDSRRRRHELLNVGLFSHTEGLLARKGISIKEIDNLKRVVFMEGSFCFSARPIPGLDNLPRVIVGTKESDRDGIPVPVSDNGDAMSVVNMTSFSAPSSLCLPQTQTIPSTDDSTQEISMDRRCADCTKSFVNLEGLMAHCQITEHSPAYEATDATPATTEIFLSYCNIVLQRAMGERMAKWGREYIDPKSFKDPTDRQGRTLGVRIFRAFSCEFGLHKPHGSQPCLTLTVDLRAKVIRTKTLIDTLCEERDPNTVIYDNSTISRAKRLWKSEVVICTYDKRCYSVIDLVFDKTPDSLPIEGQGISHAYYFAKRKNIQLKYPNSPPMVAVLGRNNATIYLPPELVCCNELDPFVKQQLPLIASFVPKERHDAIEEMKRYLTPGAQRTRGVGGGLLPALGIVLDDKRVKVQVEVLPLPLIKAAGMTIPQDKGGMWAPVISKANYRVEGGKAVRLNVVLVYNMSLSKCYQTVYNKVRDLVNRFNGSYRFGDQPHSTVEAGDNNRHWGAVERHFSGKQPDNIFVLDLSKPPRRQALDPAYSVVKHILAKAGYLSQFVNFNTYDHGNARDERKSNTILQGVARQILSKCGVRVWWVNIPKEVPVPSVFVGVDVFHAPRKYNAEQGKKAAKESVAAVIVQVIRSHDERMNCRAEVYSETFRRKAGQEMDLGGPMKQAVYNALKTLKVDPRSCIVWRDGVGDAAINQVAGQEIPAVRTALVDGIVGTVGESPRAREIPLAYIVVQKRIATKFLSVNGLRAMPSGALVITLQGPEFATFYINGTSPPYSTPKPARFVIAHMDRGFGQKKRVIADLSWSLCHDYPNWTGPIKLPSPVQMAHKLAELAGGFSDCGDSINAQKYAGKIYFL